MFYKQEHYEVVVIRWELLRVSLWFANMHQNQWNPNVDTMLNQSNSNVSKCLVLAQFCLAIVLCVAVIIFEGIIGPQLSLKYPTPNISRLLVPVNTDPYKFLICFVTCVTGIFGLCLLSYRQLKRSAFFCRTLFL